MGHLNLVKLTVSFFLLLESYIFFSHLSIYAKWVLSVEIFASRWDKGRGSLESNKVGNQKGILGCSCYWVLLERVCSFTRSVFQKYIPQCPTCRDPTPPFCPLLSVQLSSSTGLPPDLPVLMQPKCTQSKHSQLVVTVLHHLPCVTGRGKEQKTVWWHQNLGIGVLQLPCTWAVVSVFKGSASSNNVGGFPSGCAIGSGQGMEEQRLQLPAVLGLVASKWPLPPFLKVLGKS